MGKAHELDREIGMLVKQERGITRRLVEKIALFEQHHYYADLGYSSLIAWLMKHQKYTKSAAFRRMQAARLIRAVPEAKEKIESGAVNLSTLATLQTAIRQEELRTKASLPQERKEELISMIDSQSCEKVDRVIAIEFPNLDLEKKESVKPVNKSDTKFVLVFSEDDMEVLKRMRELASHAHFNASWSELYVVTAKEYVKHRDPMLKKSRKKKEDVDLERNEKEKTALETPLSLPRTAAKQALSRTDELRVAEISRSSDELRDFTSRQNGSASELGWERNTTPIPYSTRMEVLRRDNGECKYVDPVTGKSCCSRDNVEVDHVIERALGGSNHPSNLRVLCRTHNLLMARRRMGPRINSRRNRVRESVRIYVSV